MSTIYQVPVEQPVEKLKLDLSRQKRWIDSQTYLAQTMKATENGNWNFLPGTDEKSKYSPRDSRFELSANGASIDFELRNSTKIWCNSAGSSSIALFCIASVADLESLLAHITVGSCSKELMFNCW